MSSNQVRWSAVKWYLILSPKQCAMSETPHLPFGYGRSVKSNSHSASFVESLDRLVIGWLCNNIDVPTQGLKLPRRNCGFHHLSLETHRIYIDMSGPTRCTQSEFFVRAQDGKVARMPLILAILGHGLHFFTLE